MTNPRKPFTKPLLRENSAAIRTYPKSKRVLHPGWVAVGLGILIVGLGLVASAISGQPG